MDERLGELVSTLLYEGYALYPYTPDATKNATPTPFGIVYPPAYAADCDGAHDHVRMELAQQGTELTVQLQQPRRQRISRIGLDDAGRRRPERAVLAASHQAVAAAREARVDAQCEHAFVG